MALRAARQSGRSRKPSGRLGNVNSRARAKRPIGDLLLILHRAFDQSAGRRVFAADISEFIATHERFASLGPKLKSFFESSQIYFFSDDRRLAEDRFPTSELTRLAAELARQERAAA